MEAAIVGQELPREPLAVTVISRTRQLEEGS